jgi:tripartite-type tricarboxylate transporter receptor subunit TctC
MRIFVAAIVVWEFLAASQLPAIAQNNADAIKMRVEALKPADFPKQPIELVVPTPAGGGLDVAARLLIKSAEKYMDHKIFVNNRVGGGGVVAYTWLATQAPNDGSVVAIVSNSILGDSLLRAGGKWTYKDVEPVVFLNQESPAWIVSTKGPFKDKSFKEIVAMAKSEPSKINIGSMAQTVYEFLAEQIEGASGAKFTKVPFQGSAPALVSLLGGHIDVSFGYLADYRAYLASGDVRPIVISGAKRSPFLPDVPTVNEVLGTTTIVRNVFRFIGAPKGMPASHRAYLIAGLSAAIADPQFIEENNKVGAIMDPSLDRPEKISAELDTLAELERKFLIESKRLAQ